MTETEATAPSSEEQPSDPSEPQTKQTFRKKVWTYLEQNRLASYPRPAFGRIPNFKTAAEAAAKLAELDEFKAAKAVQVNPDKTLEAARIFVLESQKDLYVPIPRLKEGLLKKLALSGDQNIKQIVNRFGIENSGQTITFDDDVHIDVFVVGSVAVSKDGYRIGKGRGYADLEYAILKEMKAINDDTVIVTTVHDSQVFEELPVELFEKYDVPVDYILTPTQVIKVEKKLPRPEGVYWNILSQRRINLMLVLQQLKDKLIADGQTIVLKDTDTDVESSSPNRRFFNRRRRFVKRKPKSLNGKSSESQNENASGDKSPAEFEKKGLRQRRGYNNRPRTSPSGKAIQDKPDKVHRKSRYNVDFSLMVSNIEKTVRVRDLKNALNEHGIKPHYITWRGVRGFCYLHYVKPNPKQVPEEEKQKENESYAVDNVIDILQNLKISPDSANSFNVKVIEPITRIETTDVTAV